MLCNEMWWLRIISMKLQWYYHSFSQEWYTYDWWFCRILVGFWVLVKSATPPEVSISHECDTGSFLAHSATSEVSSFSFHFEFLPRRLCFYRCLSVHGGGGGGGIPACLAGGIPSCLAAGLQGGGLQAHTQGGSWGVWSGVSRPTPGGGGWGLQAHTQEDPPRGRLLPWAVRILLECILVQYAKEYYISSLGHLTHWWAIYVWYWIATKLVLIFETSFRNYTQGMWASVRHFVWRAGWFLNSLINFIVASTTRKPRWNERTFFLLQNSFLRTVLSRSRKPFWVCFGVA